MRQAAATYDVRPHDGLAGTWWTQRAYCVAIELAETRAQPGHLIAEHTACIAYVAAVTEQLRNARARKQTVRQCLGHVSGTGSEFDVPRACGALPKIAGQEYGVRALKELVATPLVARGGGFSLTGLEQSAPCWCLGAGVCPPPAAAKRLASRLNETAFVLEDLMCLVMRFAHRAAPLWCLSCAEALAAQRPVTADTCKAIMLYLALVWGAFEGFCLEGLRGGHPGLEETAWVPLAEHAEAAERFMAWRVEKAPPARATPEQVQRVNAMDEERPWFRFVWKRFCVERAFRVTNPEGLPSDLVEEFLEQYEGGWTDPPVLATDREAADLTARIAGAAEWEWRQYCYKHTYGVRDPRFLPSEVAQRAIREFHPGFSKISSTGPKPAGVATNPRAALFDKVSEVLRRPPTKEELAYDQVQDKGKFVATVQVTEAARGGSGTASFRGEAARTSVLACRSAALAALRAFFPKAVEMFEGLAPERTKEAHEWRMKSVLNYGKPGDQAEFASGEKVEKRAGKAGDDASEGDQALAELRQLFQDDTTIRWQWLDWCRQKDMSGTTLQDRHAGAAREFLDTRKLLPPVQLATPQEVLKLNSLRFRKEFGPATTWLWAKFCSLSAYGDCSGMEPK
ncbi:unnamed protein product, partial [Prorocentrum cordatum]